MSSLLPPRDTDRGLDSPGTSRYARWLVPVTYVASAAGFIADLGRDNILAYGLIYVPLVTTALFHRHRSGLWIVTALACVAVVVGAFFPFVNPDLPDLIGNRVLSLAAILMTAAFVQHARTNQDRLEAQTRRAEAAERIKSEVFVNLSREMRVPLHTLLGILNLMIQDSRPDQKLALLQVRSGGKQLLDTIDNLIDLTRVDELPLQNETVDMSVVLREAADRARVSANERQIAIMLEGRAAPEPNEVKAAGDSWATRRILDNLIGNAVRFAPPGGTVSIGVDRHANVITASISDTGRGIPAGLAGQINAEAGVANSGELFANGGTGLTLSHRLAHLMNGRLTVSARPGFGATISLSLPAADAAV